MESDFEANCRPEQHSRKKGIGLEDGKVLGRQVFVNVSKLKSQTRQICSELDVTSARNWGYSVVHGQ